MDKIKFFPKGEIIKSPQMTGKFTLSVYNTFCISENDVKNRGRRRGRREGGRERGRES